jgi:hypothetical protein
MSSPQNPDRQKAGDGAPAFLFDDDFCFSAPARGAQSGPYQPSIVLIAVTAFFS